METKRGVPTKILSMFLSVLMAVSCFSIALPNLASKAGASSTSDEWQILKESFEAAFNGGYLSTSNWSGVNTKDGVTTVTDNTFTGYIYNIVRALGNAVSTVVSDDGYNHNRYLTGAAGKIHNKLASEYKYELNEYQQNFVDALLPSDGEYLNYSDFGGAWNGSNADAANFTEKTMSVVIERNVKQAILADYEEAKDVPASVNTKCTVALVASPVNVESTNGSETGVKYYNTSCTVTEDATDLTSSQVTELKNIAAYAAYVEAPSFAEAYNEWYEAGVNRQQVLADRSAEELAAIWADFEPVYSLAIVADDDLIEQFIGTTLINNQYNYAKACDALVDSSAMKGYVNWVMKGEPLIKDAEEGTYYLGRDLYTSTSSRAALVELLDQVNIFIETMNALPGTVINDLVTYYGYETDAFTKLAAEIQKTINIYDLKEAKYIHDWLISNDADETYSVTSEESLFYDGTKYVEDSYALTADTEVRNKKTYYVLNEAGEYVKVETPVTEEISNYYEYIPAQYASLKGLSKNEYVSSAYGSYVLTSDTSVKTDKIYYTDATGSTVVENPVDANVASYYEFQGEECPVSDADLQLIVDFYTKAVDVLNRTAGTDYLADNIAEEKVTQIRDAYKALKDELDARSKVNARFSSAYAWFVKQMGGSIKGLSVAAIRSMIAEAESAYSTLISNNPNLVVYTARINACREFADKLYLEIYDRAYSYSYRIKNAYGSGINYSNYYVVKGEAANFNKDGLITAFNAYRGTIGAAANRLKRSIDLNYIVTSVASYQNAVNGFTLGSIASRVQSGRTTYSAFTRVVAPTDFIRTSANNFTVSFADNGNLKKTITSIDTFLANKNFTQLIGADEDGYENLNQYIKGMLVKFLFNDDIVNMVIGLLFPMLCKIFDETIVEQVKKFDGKDFSDFANTGDIDGWLSIYVDGQSASHGADPDDFVVITRTLGLNIYPSTFGQYLVNNGYAANGNKIKGVYRYWNQLDRNGDGKFDDEDLEVLGFTWGIDDIRRENYASFDQYVEARYNRTKAVLGTVFGSCLPILQTLFSTQNYSERLDGSSGERFANIRLHDVEYDSPWPLPNIKLGSVSLDKIDVKLNINAMNLYRTTWIPIMEAFGINGDVCSYNFASLPAAPGGSQLVSALLDPVYALVNAISAKPLESILKLLPNFAYHIMNGSINNFFNQQIRINVDIRDFNTTGGGGLAWLTTIPGLEDLLVKIVTDKMDIDLKVDLSDMLSIAKIEDMLGFSITDINTIAQGVIKLIDENATLLLPAINSATLVGCYNSFNTNYSTQGSRPNGVTRTYVSANPQNVLYALLKYVLEAVGVKNTKGSANVGNKNFIPSFCSFIETLTGKPLKLPEIVYTVIENAWSVNDVIAAIVELFNPNKFTMTDFDWYNKEGKAGVGEYNISLSTFVYLKYANDWTKNKAEYFYDNIDNIVDSLINTIDEDVLAQYNGNANEWFVGLINSFFTNDLIDTLVELLVKIGDKLADSPNIVKLVKQNLQSEGINYSSDLYSWYNKFGSRYAEYTTIDPKTYDDQIFGEHLRFDADAQQVYVYVREKVKENGAYVPYNANDPETYNDVKDRAYPNSAAVGQTIWNKNHTATVNLPATALDDFSNITAVQAGVDAEGMPMYNYTVTLTSETLSFMKDPSYGVGDKITLIDGDENSRALFTAMLCELLEPASPIIALLFSGTNLELFGGALKLTGYESYNGAIIPLLESLGVTGLMSQAEYNSYVKSKGTSAGFYHIVNIIFEAIENLLTDDRVFDSNTGEVISGKGAFQKVIDVLPHFFYLLQSGGLTTIVKNLLMSVWSLLDIVRPVADINLDDLVHHLLCRFFGLCYDTSSSQYAATPLVEAVLDLMGMEAVPYQKYKADEDKKKVDGIFSATLSDLSLKGIYGILESVTGLSFAPLSYAFEGMSIKNDANGNGVKKMNSYTGSAVTAPFDTTVYRDTKGAYETYTLNFAGSDVITVVFSLIYDLIAYHDNAAALDELFDLATSTASPGTAGFLSDKASAGGLIEAILKICADDDGSAESKVPNWDYLLEGKNVAIGEDNNLKAWVDINPKDEEPSGKPGDSTFGKYKDLVSASELDLSTLHTIYNLDYTTDWKYATSESIVNLLNNVMSYVVTLIDEDFNGTFKDYVEQFLNESIFTNEVLTAVVDFLAMLYRYIPMELLKAIDEFLGVSLTGLLDKNFVTTQDNVVIPLEKVQEGTEDYLADLDGDGVYEAYPQYTFEYTGSGNLWARTRYTYDSANGYKATKDVEYYILVAGGVKAADKNGKLLTDYTVNMAHPWFDETGKKADGDTTDGYVDTREEFLNAIEEILLPIAPVVGYVFLEDDFRLLHTAGQDLNNPTGDDSIVINGAGAYSTAVIPLLEAFGVDLTGYEPETYVLKTNVWAKAYEGHIAGEVCTETDPDKLQELKDKGLIRESGYASEKWIRDMFDISLDLMDVILEDPINWVLNILPNMIYFLNAGGFTAVISNTLSGIQSVLDAVMTVVDIDDVAGINLGNLDFNNITLEGIFGIVEQLVPGLHISDKVLGYAKSLYVGELQQYWSANGNCAFRMVYSEEEDVADMITILIELVLEVLMDEGVYNNENTDFVPVHYNNASAIDRLISSGSEDEDGVREGVVSQVLRALRNPSELVYSEINWNYFDEEYDLSDHVNSDASVTVPGFAFQYLNYSTLWTYDKAARTADGFEELLCGVLALLDGDKYGDLVSLSGVVDVDFVYTGETLQNILDIVSGLLYGEDAALPEVLLDVVGAVLGGDLSSWNYKYAFGGNDTFAGALGGITYNEPVYEEYVNDPTLSAAENKAAKAAHRAEYEEKVAAAKAEYKAAIEAQLEKDAETNLYYKDLPVLDANGAQTGETIKTYLVNDRASFSNGVSIILEPAYSLLAWLLFDDPFEFFVSETDGSEGQSVMITLQGADGYKQALSLLLEALGCKNLYYKEKYIKEDGTVNMAQFVSDVVVSVCNRIDEVLANPVDEIVALIPELIYFINAGGLQTVINNLLAGPLALVNKVPALIEMIGAGEITDAGVVNDLVNGLLNDALAENLDKDGDGVVSEEESLGFTMDGINLKYVFEVVEKLTGLEITDVLQNSLDKFYIGKVVAYASKCEKMAYRMTFSEEEDFGDFITILLSFVIDVAIYGQNGTAIANLVGIDPAMIQGILTFIKEGYTVEVKDIDWFYFDNNSTPSYEIVEKDGKYELQGSVLSPDTKITLPERTINYLTYHSDWTEETARYVADNRNRIIASVLKMAGLGDTTIAEIIEKNFSLEKNLYTAELLNSILNIIKPIAEQIPETLVELAGVVLDADLSVYAKMPAFEAEKIDGNRSAFVTGLVEMLSPLSIVLDWLLFGKDIQFFDKVYYVTDENGDIVKDENGNPVIDKEHDNTNDQGIEVLINLPGTEGYRYGLAPILEALGVELPQIADNAVTRDVLYILINNVLARVEVILDNPVDEVLELLPNLLYFINANGLAVSVNNLLASVVSLLNYVNENIKNEADKLTVGALLSGVLGVPVDFDLENIDLLAIANLIENVTRSVVYNPTADTEVSANKTYYVSETDADGNVTYVEVTEPSAAELGTYYEKSYKGGVQIAEILTENKIDNFFFGDLKYYTSASGKPAFKMVYSEAEGLEDMLTILVNLVLEVLLYKNEETGADNGKAIDMLLFGDNNGDGEPDRTVVSGLVSIILGLGEIQTIVETPIKWNYFDENVNLGEGIHINNNTFVYLDYANRWRYDVAKTLDESLVGIVNDVLALVAGDEEPQTINDFVAGLVNVNDLLSADLLNTVLDTVASLLYGEDAIISTELVNIIGLVLGTDLTQWNGDYRFETYDESNKDQYKADTETGLMFRNGENGKVYAIKDANDFAAGVAYILQPAQRLLGWLLLGENYNFFVTSSTGNADNKNEVGKDILVRIPGFAGYEGTLALILEALGCKNLKTADNYVGDEAALIKDIINSLVARVEEILANPIDELLGLIPELLYFINAGGLNAVVMNFASGLLEVVNYLNDSGVLDEPIDINGTALDGNVIDNLITSILNDALIGMLDKNGDGILSDNEKLSFKLADANLAWVIDVAEQLTGLSLTGAIGYKLDKLLIGDVHSYETVSLYDEAYKAVFANVDDSAKTARDRADLITIVLSVIVDVFRYVDEENGIDNAHVLADLIGIDVTLVDAIRSIISGKTAEMLAIEWFYCVTEENIDIKDVTSSTQLTTIPHTINYLKYSKNWNEEAAEYTINNLNEIVSEVLAMMGKKDSTLASIIEENFSLEKDLYTAGTLNKIVELINSVTGRVGDTILNVLGVILDCDLNAYKDMHFEIQSIKSRTDFANGLAEIIKPISGVLDWLLFGKDLKYFNDANSTDEAYHLINVSGAAGYAYGLVPLLEALGVSETKLPSLTALETVNTETVFAQLIDAVLDRAEEILADPINEVLELLPNLIYFINANGLAVSVNNLLWAVVVALDGTALDVNTLVSDALGFKVDLKHLTFSDIFAIIEGVTDVSINAVFTDPETTINKIENFYLGELQGYRSSNGNGALRMVYSATEGAHDMLTIFLNFLVEVALYKKDDIDNAKAIDMLIAGDENNDGEPDSTIVTAIRDAILSLGVKYIPGDYHWNYFNEDSDDVAPVTPDEITVPVTPFYNFLTYSTDWTEKTSNAIYDNLGGIIDAVISMTDSEESTLAEIISKNFNLYQAKYLNAILELIQKAYELLGNKLLKALGLVLDTETDLTYWKGLSFTDAEVSDYATFSARLAEIVRPVYSVLDWLLFGEDFEFFVDNATGEENLVVIAGADGYINGLAPILINLGVELPEFVSTYNCATKVTYKGAEMDFFEAILRAVLARVDEVLADPVNEVLDIIPSLLYFINANGLSNAAYNLVGGIVNAANYLVAGGVIDLGSQSIEDYLKTEMNLDTKNLDLEGIINFLEKSDITQGIKINDVFKGTYVVEGTTNADTKITFTLDPNGADNILEKFYIGAEYTDDLGNVVDKDGNVIDSADRIIQKVVYGDRTFWKMQNGKTYRGDLITTLLSFVLEVLFYEGNEDAITALLASVIDGFTVENFRVLKALISTGVDLEGAMANMDWVYFNEYATDAERDEAILAVLTNPETNILPSTTPERTINYLKYSNNWNEETATYINDNLASIVDMVINLITDGESVSLAALIDSFGIFSSEMAETIINGVGELLSSLDSSIVDTVGALFTIDLDAIKNYKVTSTFDNDPEQFAAALAEAFKGLGNLLDWMLFDREYTFFTKLNDGSTPVITIAGGEGYKYGLAPLLSALGVETDISEAVAACDPNISITEQVLELILSNVAVRLDEILKQPVDRIFDVLVNLIYFINANGLSVSLMNFAAPVDALLTEAGNAIGKDLSLNTLIDMVDLDNLNFTEICRLIKEETKIDIYSPIGEYLTKFYIGKLESFTAYDDLVNFRMVYASENDRRDFITILLTLVLDVASYSGNREGFIELLGGDEKAEGTYNSILAFLTNGEVQIPMWHINWILTEFADTGKIISPITGGQFRSIYGPLYTRQMGEYISKYLVSFVDTMIVLLGIKVDGIDIARGLEDLIKSLLGNSIYTTDLLNTVLELIQSIIPTLKEMLGEDLFVSLATIVNKSLGVDLLYWENYTVNAIQSGDEKAFVDEIIRMLRPAYPILEWLLCDKQIAFFNDQNGEDYIVVESAQGYAYGIIPILEALHCNNILSIDEYLAAAQADKDNILRNILNPLLTKINAILADPINQILDILPSVVYFLNSNGLDTIVRNTLNAVFKVIETIEPVTGKDFYEIIGFDFKLDITGLINKALEGVEEKTGFDLTEVAMDAIVELTSGKIVTVRDSKSGQAVLGANDLPDGTETYKKDPLTMVYASSGSGDVVDYVTIVLRLILRFISVKQNVKAIEAMLKDSLSDEGYKFLCSLLDNFSQMCYDDPNPDKTDGMDKIMYTVYYIFYSANVAAHSTKNWLVEFNGNYSFLNQLFATSDLAFMRQLEKSLGDLLNDHLGDIISDDKVVPNGFIAFFQRIIDFFKNIANFFRNLFK